LITWEICKPNLFKIFREIEMEKMTGEKEEKKELPEMTPEFFAMGLEFLRVAKRSGAIAAVAFRKAHDVRGRFERAEQLSQDEAKFILLAANRVFLVTADPATGAYSEELDRRWTSFFIQIEKFSE